MSQHENVAEIKSVKVLHAGSLTSLVVQGLGPALSQVYGIAIESEPGHSVALATAIKEGHRKGDLYLSADAEVNQLLLGLDKGERKRGHGNIPGWGNMQRDNSSFCRL